MDFDIFHNLFLTVNVFVSPLSLSLSLSLSRASSLLETTVATTWNGGHLSQNLYEKQNHLNVSKCSVFSDHRNPSCLPLQPNWTHPILCTSPQNRVSPICCSGKHRNKPVVMKMTKQCTKKQISILPVKNKLQWFNFEKVFQNQFL